MSDITQEILIKEQPIPVSKEGTKTILSQMENCICQIYKKNGSIGTGFFLQNTISRYIIACFNHK